MNEKTKSKSIKRETILDIARVAHTVNAAYCASLGDTSHANWENAPEWQKCSAINGVNLLINNPSAGPEATHESWYEEKKSDGWIYGEIKNSETKTHPCMVPFNRLPKEQQAKDYIFCAVVKGIIKLL